MCGAGGVVEGGEYELADSAFLGSMMMGGSKLMQIDEAQVAFVRKWIKWIPSQYGCTKRLRIAQIPTKGSPRTGHPAKPPSQPKTPAGGQPRKRSFFFRPSAFSSSPIAASFQQGSYHHHAS